MFEDGTGDPLGTQLVAPPKCGRGFERDERRTALIDVPG